jgi:hypothetical protein
MPRAEVQISPLVTIVIDAPEGSSGAETQKTLIEGIAFWQSLPTACPMPGCGAPLHFTARHPQNFHYYGLRCEGPKPHEANLGERKDGTSLYAKDDGWKDAYGGDQEGGGSAPAQATQSAPAQNSPSGGQAPQGGIAPPTIATIMRTAAGKTPPMSDANAVLAFIRECAKQDPALSGAANVQEIKQLTEAQGQAVITNLSYL